jgi:phage-related protein
MSIIRNAVGSVASAVASAATSVASAAKGVAGFVFSLDILGTIERAYNALIDKLYEVIKNLEEQLGNIKDIPANIKQAAIPRLEALKVKADNASHRLDVIIRKLKGLES